ncbi:hypothetical protein JJJ17_11400 [Paracoccus caeni]|uniref:Peptidase inhibitor I78 family protein n=1 Tax=Paracoccus caeni TaxID=657651 RepID=A0A934SJL4_9RHOB|nr:hypothetical protein [Paracoccus caeni]MBK4216532.1 hypothetical protein [Paracoccus caeni]
MTQIKFLLPALAATAVLAGCMPAPRQAQMPAAPMPAPVVEPVISSPPPTTGISGLQERTPDLCGAKNYSSSISQPGSVIPTLGITKDYRVVEYRGIEPQDYNPNRIVFRLDSSGVITNIDCG